MDYLKNGIGLRAMAQRDPLVEYQREGFEMFTRMQDGIKEDATRLVNKLQVQVKTVKSDEVEVESDVFRTKLPKLTLAGPSESGESEARTDTAADDDGGSGNRAERRKKKRR